MMASRSIEQHPYFVCVSPHEHILAPVLPGVNLKPVSHPTGVQKTVQEATELSQLFLRVEDIFASGNLLKISETLATMRRSLQLVGDVPEFKGGMRRLEVGSYSLLATVTSVAFPLPPLLWHPCPDCS